MSFSEAVLFDFEQYCGLVVGEVLRMNFLGLDGDVVVMGHIVADGADPILCKDGSFVREVKCGYSTANLPYVIGS